MRGAKLEGHTNIHAVDRYIDETAHRPFQWRQQGLGGVECVPTRTEWLVAWRQNMDMLLCFRPASGLRKRFPSVSEQHFYSSFDVLRRVQHHPVSFCTDPC